MSAQTEFPYTPKTVSTCRPTDSSKTPGMEYATLTRKEKRRRLDGLITEKNALMTATMEEVAELRRLRKICGELTERTGDAPAVPLEALADCICRLALAQELLIAVERQAYGIDPQPAADRTDEAIVEAARLLDRVSSQLSGREDGEGP